MTWLDRLALGFRARLPPVLQTEVAECGLACLCMVADYHGQRHDLSSLRRRYPISAHGATLEHLIEIATDLGLGARALRLDLDELPHLATPCILHWQFRHFVVLERLARGKARVLDPALGPRRLDRRQLSDAFTGVALELWPRPSFERRDERRHPRLAQIVGPVRGAARALAQIMLLAFALEAFTIASPLLLKWIIDDALAIGDRELLSTLAIAAALAVLARELAAAARAWVIMRFGTLLNVQWQANTLAHLLRLPHAYFERRHTGDIVSRFRSIDVIERTLSGTLAEVLVDGVTSIVIAALLLWLNPALTALPLAAVALYALGRLLSYRRLRTAAEAQARHAAIQDSHLLETVRGARTLKLFNRAEARTESWVALLVEQVNAGLRARKLEIGYRALNGLLFGLENVLVIWLGARLVLEQSLSIGMLVAFLAYKSQLTARLGALVDELCALKTLEVHAARVADIVLTAPEHPPAPPRLALAEPRAAGAPIDVRALRFRYAPHEREVLSGIDLSIPAGEHLAIVGASGSGKTTLLLAMLGVLEPSAGEILVDGLNLAGGPAALSRVAGVTQDDTLFAGSIADNISCFDRTARQEEIERCARLASIHDEVSAMPMAYNTLVGYLGGALSGGQQQRLLLARALYRRPRVLILDEATSHLDLRRESEIAAALGALPMTRIVVAHRPETVAAADRVVVLARGRIARSFAARR